jgi:sulfopyruvate decarboxylase subunit beta
MQQQKDRLRIPFRDALRAIADVRQDSDVVITNQGSARVWPLIATHTLDFHFNPSTMGGAIPLATGLALAQPQRQIIVLSGDGSLLMSMGSLVSSVAARCRNLSVVLLDNDRYDVTGGQDTAATHLNVRFDDMARSVGFESVSSYCDASSWRQDAQSVLQSNGPRFCWLKVESAVHEDLMTPAEPMRDQLARIHNALIE